MSSPTTKMRHPDSATSRCNISCRMRELSCVSSAKTHRSGPSSRRKRPKRRGGPGSSDSPCRTGMCNKSSKSRTGSGLAFFPLPSSHTTYGPRCGRDADMRLSKDAPARTHLSGQRLPRRVQRAVDARAETLARHAQARLKPRHCSGPPRIRLRRARLGEPLLEDQLDALAERKGGGS